MTFLKRYILFACLILGLTACGESSDDTIRIGTHNWPGYEPVHLAYHLGFLPKSDYELPEFPSATQSMEAFRKGETDIAALTLDEALLLKSEGYDLRIFLVADISHGADVIIGAPNLRDIKDLKGKTIGVEQSALGGYVLSRALALSNMSIDDVKVRNLPIKESEVSFLKGEIDAVVTFEPSRARLIKSGGNELFTSREIPGEIVDVFVTSEAAFHQHKEKIRKFVSAWFQAVDYISINSAQSAKFIGERLSLSTSDVLKALGGIVIPKKAENLALLEPEKGVLSKSAQKLSMFMVERKLMKDAPSIINLFNTTALETENKP